MEFALHVFCFSFFVLLAEYADASRVRVLGRDVELLESYDFIIVGRGTSGLTVADRLTENPNDGQLTIYSKNCIS